MPEAARIIIVINAIKILSESVPWRQLRKVGLYLKIFLNLLK